MNGEVHGMKYAYDALGTLLEAAMRDQKSTADAVRAMKSLTAAIEQQSRSMPAAIVADVKSQLDTTIEAAAKTLTSRVESANLAADRAMKALDRAATFSVLRICAPVLLVSLAAMATWYGVTAWSVSRLEQQKTDLEQRVAYLDSRGGRLDVTSCRLGDGRSVPCIRVDETVSYKGGYRIPIRVK